MASNQTKGAASGAVAGAYVGSSFGPIGTVVGAVIGGIGGALTGSGADEAEDLAEFQAELAEMEARENNRRMRLRAAQISGLARATVYASNLQNSGTSQRYLNSLASTENGEIAWQNTVSRIQAKIVRAGGQAQSRAIMSSLYASQISFVGRGLAKSYQPSQEQAQTPGFSMPSLQSDTSARLLY